MAFDELLKEFHGQRVIDFDEAGSWKGPKATYRLSEGYDEDGKLAERLATLLDQPDCKGLTASIAHAE